MYVRGDCWSERGTAAPPDFEKGTVGRHTCRMSVTIYPEQDIYEIEFSDGLFDVPVEEMSTRIDGIWFTRQRMREREKELLPPSLSEEESITLQFSDVNS